MPRSNQSGPDLLSQPDAAAAALSLIENQWNEAARNWSPEAFTAIYTDDALFFGGRPGFFVGRERIEQYYRSYVGVVSSAALKYSDQSFIELAPETVLAQGFAHFSFTLASGAVGDTILRSTNVLVMRGKTWKVIQHHFSEPIDEPPIHNARAAG